MANSVFVAGSTVGLRSNEKGRWVAPAGRRPDAHRVLEDDVVDKSMEKFSNPIRPLILYDWDGSRDATGPRGPLDVFKLQGHCTFQHRHYSVMFLKAVEQRNGTDITLLNRFRKIPVFGE